MLFRDLGVGWHGDSVSSCCTLGFRSQCTTTGFFSISIGTSASSTNESCHFCYIQVILASSYFAVFRVKLTAKKLEGVHDGAIQITTDYEVRALWDPCQWGFSKKFNSFSFFCRNRTEFTREVTVYLFYALTEFLRIVYRILVFVNS